MNFFNHLISFLLAVLLHVLVLLAAGNRILHNAAVATQAPELEVTSVELTLAEEAPKTEDGGQPTEERGERTEVPELALPEPAEPAPAEAMPDKPDFTAALTPPPPAPQPQPSPVAAPAPAPAPVVPAVIGPPPSVLRPPSSAPAPAPAGPAASIQPAGGGATGRVDAHPSLERAIKPNYPIGARRRGEEGTVILDVTVDRDGRAARVVRVASSGYPELDRAAERAAAQARFKPGTRDGQPAESAARLTLIFRLRER